MGRRVTSALIAALMATSLLASTMPAQAATSHGITTTSHARKATPVRTILTLKASATSFIRGEGTSKVSVTVKKGTKLQTGKVYVYDGTKKVKTLTLSKGKTSYTLPKTASQGKHTLKFVHATTKRYAKISVTVKARAKATVSTSFPSFYEDLERPVLTAKVTGATGGSFKFGYNGKTFATVAVKSGKATATYPYRTVGTHTITATYVPASAYVAPPKTAPRVEVTVLSITQFPGDTKLEVGTQIRPGFYYAYPPSKSYSDRCTWIRWNEEKLPIIPHSELQLFSGRIYALVTEADTHFRSSGCGTWTRASDEKHYPTELDSQGRITMWRVGYDMQPGTYEVDLTGADCTSLWPYRLGDRAMYSRWELLAYDHHEHGDRIEILPTDGFVRTPECGILRLVEPTL